MTTPPRAWSSLAYGTSVAPLSGSEGWKSGAIGAVITIVANPSFAKVRLPAPGA